MTRPPGTYFSSTRHSQRREPQRNPGQKETSEREIAAAYSNNMHGSETKKRCFQALFTEALSQMHRADSLHDKRKFVIRTISLAQREAQSESAGVPYMNSRIFNFWQCRMRSKTNQKLVLILSPNLRCCYTVIHTRSQSKEVKR